MYSPRTFRELILPRLKTLAARCTELGLHYVWRTDGNIWLVADMIFREAGVPGYGEVDYDASMQPAAIRERYPDLVLWGTISADLLWRATPDEVYRHCRQIVADSGGKRYFHGCSNAVLPRTPAENVWAMMRARDEHVPGTRLEAAPLDATQS
jgi:uroporphyrinogen-III decarboxylase